MSRFFSSGPKADTPVDDPIPDDWEQGSSVTESDVSRQIRDRGEPPPLILTPFEKKVIPTYAQPSNRLTAVTYQFVPGGAPQRVVQKQTEGLACRVHLLSMNAVGNVTLLAAHPGSLVVPNPLLATFIPNNAIVAPNGTSATAGLQYWSLSISSELWAISIGPGASDFLSVLTELYDADAHTWEPWQVGQG